MSTPLTISEETITASELKDGLDAIQKRDEELSFRAGKTLDHLNHLSLLPKKQREELYKKIEGLNVPRLKQGHIHKILDVMPRNVKELNVILSGYTLTVNKEYQQQIVDALQG